MAFAVIAYPQISHTDFASIQQCRQSNDALYYTVVAPHFTFVFPVEDIAQARFEQEITERASNCKKISFVLRCATVNKDAFSDYYHVFLVPDEGYSSIVKLHDRLYSGLLKEHLRLDLDFIPHVGIANSKESLFCKRLADKWNSQPFEIRGILSHLSLIEYDGAVVTSLKEIALC